MTAFKEPEKGPVGLEDEAAFEASMVFGSEDGPAGDETIVLPHDQDDGQSVGLAEDQPKWVGKTLGHFKLLRTIAEGSMGIVIQAMDVNLHRIVALKVLRKRIVGFDDRQRVDQFLREARAAARLDHPNVVRIYEINEHDGWWYIAMEMVEGGSVKNIVTTTGGMQPGRACPVIADAAVALAAAHSLGIIHRDVKPGNLMVSRGGRCKLTDFGLVRLYDPNDPFDFTTKAVGTPQFVAPEVIRDHRSASASDVYSLGGTLYYTLTGHPPYVDPKVAGILNQHLEGPLPELSKYLTDYPESLDKLVQWAMAKDPAMRPSAADFATALHSEAIDWRDGDSGWRLQDDRGHVHRKAPDQTRLEIAPRPQAYRQRSRAVPADLGFVGSIRGRRRSRLRRRGERSGHNRTIPPVAGKLWNLVGGVGGLAAAQEAGCAVIQLGRKARHCRRQVRSQQARTLFLSDRTSCRAAHQGR